MRTTSRQWLVAVGCFFGLLGVADLALAQNFATANSTNSSAWLTLYVGRIGGREILETRCVPSGGITTFDRSTHRRGVGYYIRAEMKRTPDCKGVTDCDTTITMTPSNYYRLHASPQTCWWVDKN